MASDTTKLHRPPPDATGEEPDRKRAKPQSEPSPRVVLNPADCNLDFDVEDNGLEGHALHQNGFAYCWSGARATVGITRGKYCFGCKIISEQKVDMEDTPPDQRHLCRVGISRGDDPVGNLGESDHSFGFGGTGKFSTAGKFSDYGVKFGIGDAIVCAVNLEDKPLASIGFSKNGKWLGNARKFDAGPRGLGVIDSTTSKLAWASALFPHVLLKNVVVQMQFSIEDGLLPVEDYKPWSSAIEDGSALAGPIFSKPNECEVLMMVGLPASGKTTWAEKWIKEHPEKRYILLGTNLALDQMKVPGLLRKHNYGERFERLMDRATGIFNTLISRASRMPRNYILDQTNVYKSARKRKLREFANYQKIAVVIFPTPDELKHRAQTRFKEMGKEVPAEAVNEMLANYVLPTSKGMPRSDELFDEVMFPELVRAESQRYLDEMKRDLQITPTSTGKECSSYSCQSSVRSFDSPSLGPNKAISDSGGRFPLPDRDFRSSLANQAHCQSGSYGTPDYPSGPYQFRASDPLVSMPGDGNYSVYGRNTSNLRDAHGPYGLNSGTDHYSKTGSQMNMFTGGEPSSYGRTGSNNAQIDLKFEKPSSIGRYDYQDSRTVLPDISPNIPSGGPRMPPVGTQVPRHSPFDRYSSSGTPTMYSGPSPYEGPREVSYEQQPMPSSYGSHGTPPPNPYGNRPQMSQWHSPRYPSPGSWYR